MCCGVEAVPARSALDAGGTLTRVDEGARQRADDDEGLGGELPKVLPTLLSVRCWWSLLIVYTRRGARMGGLWG
jgi:hypothetical protein